MRWNEDLTYGGVPVGGLSSIDWDAARGEFVLVSDDRSVHGPARFYSAHMQYDERGLHKVWLTGMHALLSPAQQRVVRVGTPGGIVAVEPSFAADGSLARVGLHRAARRIAQATLSMSLPQPVAATAFVRAASTTSPSAAAEGPCDGRCCC